MFLFSQDKNKILLNPTSYRLSSLAKGNNYLRKKSHTLKVRPLKTLKSFTKKQERSIEEKNRQNPLALVFLIPIMKSSCFF